MPVILSIVIFLFVFSLQLLLRETLLQQNWIIYALVALGVAAGAFFLISQVILLEIVEKQVKGSRKQ